MCVCECVSGKLDMVSDLLLCVLPKKVLDVIFNKNFYTITFIICVMKCSTVSYLDQAPQIASQI